MWMLLFLQVKHIRDEYGDYFGITVAGYPGFLLLLLLFSTMLSLSVMFVFSFFVYSSIPLSFSLIFSLSFSSEAHPDVIASDGVAPLEGYQNDLAYLKSKVL